MKLAAADRDDGTAGQYRFGDVVVDAPAHTLSRDGAPQQLEPKAFAVLLALLQRPGELVARDDLLDLVWGHRHVTPGVITRAIAQLRHALDDDSHRPRYIQTEHALGYRFIGALEHGDGEAAAEPAVEEAREPPAPGTGIEPPPTTETAFRPPDGDAAAAPQPGEDNRAAVPAAALPAPAVAPSRASP